MQCLESPIQPKGIRFNPFLNFSFFFHRQGKWWEKCSPLPWSKRQLGWGLAPFSAPKPSLQGATQPILLAGNQVSPRHPNPFFPGPRWLDFSSPALPRQLGCVFESLLFPGQPSFGLQFWGTMCILEQMGGSMSKFLPFSPWEHIWVFQAPLFLGDKLWGQVLQKLCVCSLAKILLSSWGTWAQNLNTYEQGDLKYSTKLR